MKMPRPHVTRLQHETQEHIENETIIHREMVSKPHLCCEIFRVLGIFFFSVD